jgi:hypothetical protein
MLTMIYTTVLLLHSWVRWVVILAGLVAVGRAWLGWFGGKSWARGDDTAGAVFTRALDVQFLLGLVLYLALSPTTHAALRDFGGAMANSALRFWAVEHVFGMLIGLALAHVGHVRVKRLGLDARRHKVAAIFFTLAMIAILASVPWPGTPNARPFIRW